MISDHTNGDDDGENDHGDGEGVQDENGKKESDQEKGEVVDSGDINRVYNGGY